MSCTPLASITALGAVLNRDVPGKCGTTLDGNPEDPDKSQFPKSLYA
ncbi:MAG: hypothetical protein WAP74_00380 [Patescibacteria group bacterium]